MSQETTTQDVRNVIEDYDYWMGYEHDKWKLLSFSGRRTARFGWLEQGLQYTKYVNIARSQIDFLVGVAPDVLDDYMA